MAKSTLKQTTRDVTRHKRKKTTIGNSYNSKNNKYRGQGK